MNFQRLPYQDTMHDHLVERDRAALFCGIGLSKTAATLSAFRTLVGEGAAKSMLVVAPKRVANLTWPNEVKKWDQFRHFKIERLRDVGDKPSGKAQIYLTSYDRLLKTVRKPLRRTDPTKPQEYEYESKPRYPDLSFCDTVVFDELTRAKNPASGQIDAIRPLLGNRRRWGLTGTPRPNSLLELFAQVRLLDDGKRLTPSFTAFRDAYFTAEDYQGYNYTPKPGAEERVYKRIHDLVLTMRSSDHLDIADTVEEDVEVSLPQSAHGVYKELERELMVLVNEQEVNAVNAAVLSGKLLQITGGAVYSSTEMERQTIHVHDAKINALKRLLVDLNGESALLLCNYVHERERILAAIPGATDAAAFKGDLEDAWNSKRIKYLVADPRSMGHGLNLQVGGRNTIWFSPTYSRELYDQANGRTARKGQLDVPRVYRILCSGTIDDAVVETLRERGDNQTAMMKMLTHFRTQGLAFTP